MWNVTDRIGTLYTNHDTRIGHLLQTAYWLDNQQWKEFHGIIPWEYHNIINIVKGDIRNWDQWFNLNTEPIDDPADHYCSVLTSGAYENQYQMAWSFMHILDLQLHDAAATYTYLAAEKTGKRAEQYAQIACNLWQYSRQLRVDAARPKCQDHIANVIYPGMKS
jgi:hypothetical protein